MRLRDDRRGAALQVGAVLLLGFLVIGLSLYQATVVPTQNERAEFDHNRQVQEGLQDLRNGVLRTATSGGSTPTTVQLGTRYPTRIVAVNPPPSSGRLATEPGGSVTLVDATAVDEETADFWNGTTRSYATRRLSYTPDYSVYQSAPETVYDDTVLYDLIDGSNRSQTDQILLSGNRITVISLNGSLSRAGTDAVSVSPSAVSASDRTVAVDGDDVQIRVDTQLPVEEWRTLLEPQYESNGGRVEGDAGGVQVADGTLTVDLVPGTYRLRMAKVGVGTGVTDTTEAYLTVVDGTESATTGGTRRIELEVRDRYNNPVAGVTVNASLNSADASVRPNRAVTDEDGRVVFEYVAPTSLTGGSRTDTLNFTYEGSADRPDFDGGEPESVGIDVTVVSLAGVTGDVVDTFDDRNLSEYEGDPGAFDVGQARLRSTAAGDVYAPSDGGLDNYPARGDTIRFEFETRESEEGAFRFGTDDDGNGGYELRMNAGGTFELFDRQNPGTSDGNSTALAAGEPYVIEIEWGVSSNSIVATAYEQTADGEGGSAVASVQINGDVDQDDGTAIGFAADGPGVVFDDVTLV